MGTNLTGETWGVSGSTFLFLYVLVALVTLGAVLHVRRTLRAGRPVDADELAGRPEDVAYLNGGRELAVYAALSAMHVDGSITTADRAAGMVRAARPVPAHGSRLQRAIHAATTRLALRRGLVHDAAVDDELGATHDRLVRSGLLLSADGRARHRSTAFWMLGVFVLGFVRAMADTANGHPVGFLVVAMLLAGLAFLVLALRAPERTAAGHAALAEQRSRNAALAPSTIPGWGTVGAGAAALSVGVFGVGALFAAEPAFAEELAARRGATGSGRSGDGGAFAGGAAAPGGLAESGGRG